MLLNWVPGHEPVKTDLTVINNKNYTATNEEYDTIEYMSNWYHDEINNQVIEPYTNNSQNSNNDGIDSTTNKVTMTQQELQALIEKSSNINTSHLSYTAGEFQVNDAYYTTTGELISHENSKKPTMTFIPGANIIDRVDIKHKKTEKPHMTYDADIPYNYYYTQTVDPNTTYPYDTEETPITRQETFPFFENRRDRPTTFNGTSHTYMHPKNWRYPEEKAPDCKIQTEPNQPTALDRRYITLDQWDSQIGTILPKFTYKEPK
jgi:hypothetical protein